MTPIHIQLHWVALWCFLMVDLVAIANQFGG